MCLSKPSCVSDNILKHTTILGASTKYKIISHSRHGKCNHMEPLSYNITTINLRKAGYQYER